MKKLLLGLVFCLAVGVNLNAQVTINGFSNDIASESDVRAKDGTFEVQQTSKIEIVYTTENWDQILRLIELERRENEDVYVIHNDHVTFFIPSKNSLDAK